LDNCHLDTFLREQGCGKPWLFLEAEMGPRSETFGKNWSIRIKLFDKGRFWPSLIEQ